jgi:hypothetical protein
MIILRDATYRYALFAHIILLRPSKKQGNKSPGERSNPGAKKKEEHETV